MFARPGWSLRTWTHIILVNKYSQGFQLIAIAAVLSTAAACAPSSLVTEKSDLVAPSRYASLGNHGESRLTTEKRAPGTKLASSGVASFYAEGARTASGEKFDPHALTAVIRRCHSAPGCA